MSSYWAGYSGTGLVLTVPEFNKMLKQYKEKNPDQSEIIDTAIENGDLNETGFIMSATDKTFTVFELSDDDVAGVTFFPFYRSDGRENVTEKKEDGKWEYLESNYPIWDLNEDRCYFLFSDKDMNSVKAFDEKPYASYQDFVQEFKNKIGGYLPENFDWDAHLGNLTYAAYA